MEKINHVHIVGCGDIGRRVGRLFLDKNWAIRGYVRSEANQLTAINAGIPCERIDIQLNANAIVDRLGREPFSLLYFVPPSSYGAIDTRLSAFLSALTQKNPNKIVLISTTGVYGDCQGNWIDETAPLQSTTERAVRRVNAEKQLRSWAEINHVDFLILRVPGIYAKNRLPIKRIERGEPIVCANEAPWTNRIHADDLAQACLLAITSSVKNTTVNICDDQPSTMTTYFNAVADYAGLNRPPQISLEAALKTLSPGMKSYLQESRRINNAKMKSVLGVQLQYPNLKAGLAT